LRRYIQEHRYFNNFFLSLIYINTVLMAVGAYHSSTFQLNLSTSRGYVGWFESQNGLKLS